MILFDPVGLCIYCGSTDDPLGDEHIIPLGLYGQHVLPRASCRRCERITGKFEGVVQRTILGDVRMRNRFPTRRPKQRPEQREINTTDGPKSVSTAEYPAPYVVYQYGSCGLFLDAPPELVLPFHTPVVIPDNEHDAFQKKHKWDGLISFRYQPHEFSRMILKIGHGFAVAYCGVDAFRHLAVPFFMEGGRNVTYLVGQNEKKEPKNDGAIHSSCIKVTASGGKKLVVAEVRLFAGAETPTYHAVVGEIESPTNLTAILQKLRDAGGV